VKKTNGEALQPYNRSTLRSVAKHIAFFKAGFFLRQKKVAKHIDRTPENCGADLLV